MKLPSQAKLAFKGKIFDIYQWDQEMFDGSTEVFEMIKRTNTIEIIATVGEKIYIAKQSQPNKYNFYSLFGGQAEEGEDPLKTAKRELLEESGFESDDWELLKSFQPLHKMDWQIYRFVARNCKKVAEQKLDSGEKIETIECTFEEFLKIAEDDNFFGRDLTLDLLRMEKNRSLETLKRKIFIK